MEKSELSQLNKEIMSLESEMNKKIEEYSPNKVMGKHLQLRNELMDKLNEREKKSLGKLADVGAAFWFKSFIILAIIGILILNFTKLKEYAQPYVYFIIIIVSIIFATLLRKSRNSVNRHNRIRKKLCKNPNIANYFNEVDSLNKRMVAERNELEKNASIKIIEIKREYNLKLNPLRVKRSKLLNEALKTYYNKHLFLIFQKSSRILEDRPFTFYLDGVEYTTGYTKISKSIDIMLNPGIHTLKWQARVGDYLCYVTKQIDTENLPLFYIIDMTIEKRAFHEVDFDKYVSELCEETKRDYFGAILY